MNIVFSILFNYAGLDEVGAKEGRCIHFKQIREEGEELHFQCDPSFFAFCLYFMNMFCKLVVMLHFQM